MKKPNTIGNTRKIINAVTKGRQKSTPSLVSELPGITVVLQKKGCLKGRSVSDSSSGKDYTNPISQYVANISVTFLSIA